MRTGTCSDHGHQRGHGASSLPATLRRGLHRLGIAPIRHGGSAWPLTVYRYRLPPSLSWAATPGRVDIPLGKVTTATGFSYGEGGWHPHVETLRWLGSPDAPEPAEAARAEQSPLGRLYTVFHPRTVREAVFDDLQDPVPGMTEVPLVRGQLRELWNPHGARPMGLGKSLDQPGLYWGPASREHVATEVDRTLAVYRGLAATGLRDDGPRKDAITGYLLIRGDDYRFVVHQGHHRLACLAVLEQDSVPVYLSSKAPPVISEDRLDRWCRGRHARYTPSIAQLLFARLFESTGREKAARLGLLPSPEAPHARHGHRAPPV